MRSGSPDRVVVAIDDTDMPGTPGTGRLARALTESIRRSGAGDSRGVTRHQLYEGPGVPKTSRNSAAAIVLGPADPDEVMALGERFLLRRHADGSDPGIAVLVGPPPAEVLAFARRAQRELVSQAEAVGLAGAHDIRLTGLAGTRDGMIGALAAAALRADGGDGRFVSLPGIRDLSGRMSVHNILRKTGIAAVVDEETGRPLEDEHLVETHDWVRPRVIGHLPILMARRREGDWVHADTRPGKA